MANRVVWVDIPVRAKKGYRDSFHAFGQPIIHGTKEYLLAGVCQRRIIWARDEPCVPGFDASPFFSRLF
ncbi:MAG: hypothetical protein AABY90_08980 [Nitrospirota bacterium]|jgi:hypothetical protein